MRTVVLDIETNRLVDPDRIWCIVCKDLETGKVDVFREPDLYPDRFLSYLSDVSCWIGHNLLGFDLVQLCRLVTDRVREPSVCDTLVLSRLLHYGLDDGHSLEAWGIRLGSHKIQFSDFSKLTEEMVEYCIQDVELTAKLYHHLLQDIDLEQWQQAIDLEHQTARYCQQMHEVGFAFDIEAAQVTYKEIVSRLAILDKEIIDAFPPKAVLVREITPKLTKSGTLHRSDFRWLSGNQLDLTPYSADCPFSLIEFVPFNPGSTSQIVDRLNKAGWQPTDKTKGHIEFDKFYQRLPPRLKKDHELKRQEWLVKGWKVSEENLATLPDTAPKASQLLKERLILDRRRSTYEEWFAAYRATSGRIHGKINHIGAWTHRCSHNDPNLANIVRLKKDKKTKLPIAGYAGGYGLEMRSCWIAPKGRKLVGVDADGIQLRVLAHYMEDPVFTEALINGSSEDGTDAHSLNQRALGDACGSRDLAKTFIYSWLLGAGAAKTASILGVSLGAAREARDRFVTYYPGLQQLKEEQVPRDARRGFFEGFDGRLVQCDSEHLMLSGYLQNGEAIIMKKAMSIWIPQLDKEGIDYRLVDFVHDEWVIECPDDPDITSLVLDTAASSIALAGRALGLKCPMKGNGRVGKNWAEVH